MFDKNLAKRGGVVAVADIGGGSAAVAYVSIKLGEPACVLAAERSVLPLEERSKEATITGIGSALVEAAQKAEQSYRAKNPKASSPGSLYCIVRAPWTRSKTAHARSDLPEATVVTGAMIGELAKKALAAEKELDKKNLLEASVVRVELNGYPTGNPEKQRAHSLSVAALVSECDPQLRASVEAGLSRAFPHLKPTYRSSARAILAALEERADRGEDHFIVEVLSEATALIAVREGGPAEQQVVAEGVRSLLKRVAPGGMPEETLNLVRLLATDQCSTEACANIQAAMLKIEPELVRVFGEGMTALASSRRLPNTLILAVQKEMVPWLTKFFSRIDFSQFTQTTKPFAVEALSPADLERQVVPVRGVTLDTGLALSVALVNREEQS
jgi:hypothetical protein